VAFGISFVDEFSGNRAFNDFTFNFSSHIPPPFLKKKKLAK
jgi:hypothetical protein